MTIFEIDDAILSCVDMETGEIIDEERLDSLQMEREKKIENVALWQKQLTAEANAIAEEIKKLQARKQSAEKQAEKLKEYLSFHLSGAKFSTPRVDITFRKSEAVVIDDQSALEAFSPEFIKVTYTPDKTKIKTALKNGGVFGAHLETRQNIVIK